MTKIDPEADPPRTTGGCLFTAAASTTILAMVVFYFGTLLYFRQGRPPEGDRVQMTFTTCEGAHPILQARVEAMGLGAPVVESNAATWSVTSQFPSDPRVAAAIPETLATTGQFEVFAGPEREGEPLLGRHHIDYSIPQIDLFSSPNVLVQLNPEGGRALVTSMERNRGSVTTVWLDGVKIEEVKNNPPQTKGQLELAPPSPDSREGVEQVAAWSIVLGSGPLPCETSVRAVETVQVVQEPERVP